MRALRIAPTWLTGYAGVILLVTLLVNLATQLGRNLYGLTIPSMRDSLGLSYAQAGSLVTASAGLGMVASFAFGTLASRYGTRWLVGAAAIAAGGAMVLLGTAPNFIMALAMSGLVGFAVQGCTTPVMGLLSVWFDSRNRGTVAGLAAGGGGFSFLIIGALVPWLTGRDPEDGWRHAWYIMAVISVAAGVVSLLFLRDGPREAPGVPRIKRGWPLAAYRNRLVWLIAFLAVCSGWCVGIYTTFFGAYLEQEGMSLATSGRLWGLMGILGIGSGVLWGNLSDRMGRPLGFLFSFAGFGLGFVFIWLTPVLAGFVASVFLVGLCSRAAYTICAASAGDYVAPQISAAAFGLMGMGAGFGNAMGPLIGGRIADTTGDLGWVYALAIGAAVAAVVGSIFLSRPTSGSHEGLERR